MKKSRFTEEQILYALRQAESGTPQADVCRKLGMQRGRVLHLEETLWEPGAQRGEGAQAATR